MTSTRRRARAAAQTQTHVSRPAWLSGPVDVEAWVGEHERPPAEWLLGDELWRRVTAHGRHAAAGRKWAAEHGGSLRELRAASRDERPTGDVEPLPRQDYEPDAAREAQRPIERQNR